MKTIPRSELSIPLSKVKDIPIIGRVEQQDGEYLLVPHLNPSSKIALPLPSDRKALNLPVRRRAIRK